MRNQCGSQSAGFCVWGGKSQLVLCLAVGLLAFTSAARGAQITDDFNDGNDSANPTWTRYDPLAAFGSPASFGFPNGNSYRIQTPGFPTSPAGAPRAASYLNNQNYSTFSISVDVLDWNNSINQAYGVLARLNSVGLGATTGYALNPARDFGPRLAHALLPIPGKGGSDWGYAWVPVVGPLIGAAFGALLAKAVIPS